MQRNIFAQSMYYNVHGTIIEIQMSLIHSGGGNSISEFMQMNEVSKCSDWVVDYTGKIYKNRYQDLTVVEITEFLNSDRKKTVYANTMQEAFDIASAIVEAVVNYNEFLKTRNQFIVFENQIKSDYLVLNDID